MTSEAKAQNCQSSQPCISSTNSGGGSAIQGFGALDGGSVVGNNSGGGSGVLGISSGPNSIGVEGEGASYGVYGFGSDGGVGVSGTASSGFGNGVVGIFGNHGTNNNFSNSGVYGVSDKNAGTVGTSTVTMGVFGNSTGNSFANGVVGTYGSPQLNNAFSQSGVYGASDTNAGVVGTSSATRGIGVYGTATGSGGIAVFSAGNLTVTGACLGCGAGGSDIRLKKNVTPIAAADALGQLLQLRGVTFEWINPEKQANQIGTQRGFVAQEVEKVFPNWVHEGNDGFKIVDYRQTEALEVESIRALKTENDALKAAIDRQNTRIANLERGHAPVLSFLVPSGVGGLAALGLVPLGVLLVRRRREEAAKGV
jgi:hypothetical protein